MIPKITTLAEYQQLASRTCPDLGVVENDLHMWSGVMTEVGETIDMFKKNLAYKKPLDLVNVGEEIADTCWYELNNLRIKGITINEEFVKSELLVLIEKLEEDEVPNDEKQRVIYTLEQYRIFNSSYDDCSVEENIAFYMFICHIWNLDFYQLLTNNISKLMVRYPENFTNEAAINRNLDAEREQLEK